MPPITDVVKNLLIINVLFFIAGFIFNTDMLALRYPGSDEFMPVQLATHFFMHANFMHLFFNMFALVMFGSALEALWGPQRFLFFYFFCAAGAVALHLGYNYWDFSQMSQQIAAFQQNPTYENFWAYFDDVPLDRFSKIGGAYARYSDAVQQLSDNLATASAGGSVVQEGVGLMNEYLEVKKSTPVVGASGAIYGLLLGFGMQFPNMELMLIFLPIPIKAKYFIPVLMLVELYLGFNRFAWDNIAHFAHLGGAVSGFLLILYWRKFGRSV